MWKKEDDTVGAQPELGSKKTPDLESLGDALIESLMDSRFKKENLAVGPQKVLAEDHHQPSLSPTMTTYTEAVNEFTKNATAFVEQLPLLAKARNAYEQAMKASAELRKLVDTGEENLRTLMTQLEQGINLHGIKSAPDKKNPEPAKVEAIRGTDEGRSRGMRLP
jgi:hypothetical protein